MKLGDKVRFIKSGPIDWETEDWSVFEGLRIGDIGTVVVIDVGRDSRTGARQPYIRLSEEGFGLHPDHFEVVEE